MTDWNTAADDYLRSLAAKPAARAPMTWGEVLGASWEAAGLETPLGLTAIATETFHDLERALAEETGGKNIDQFTNSMNGLGAAYWFDRETQAEYVRNNLDKLPEAARNRIAPLTDLKGRTAEKAHAIEDRAAEAAEGTYFLGGTALTWMAGFARQAVDPINMASMLVGGPLEGPILKVLGREALIGMGVVAATEPHIEAQKAEYGLQPGDPLFNIAAAGIGTAGFAGLFRMAAAGGRALAPPRPAPGIGETVGADLLARIEIGELSSTPEAQAAARAFDVRPRTELDPRVSIEDLHSAAMLVERDQVMDAGAVPRTAAGRVDTGQKIDAAAAAVEEGRAVPPPERPPPAVPAPGAVPFEGQIAAPVLSIAPKRLAVLPNDVVDVIRPGGGRLRTRPVVVELDDLTVSHDADGRVNPAYPAQFQPRDRSGAASLTFIAEKSRTLETQLLGRSVTSQEGAPIVGPDLVMESGNGRALMIARAYERHPEKAAAYRKFLEDQGYDVTDFKRPVLVRVRESELTPEERVAFTREANVSTVAGLSAREQAFADAKGLTDDMLSLWTPGETASAANVRFVRAFADRIVAAEERPQFVAGDRLSAAGARRIEAALVARAWDAADVVSALYEDVAPTSRAILGAMADTAPKVARLKTAIAEGRVPADVDPTPAMLAGFRLVENARATGKSIELMVRQGDLETGPASEEIAAAVSLYFRDPVTLKNAAGRDVVAARMDAAVQRAIDKQNAVADMFGVPLDVAATLRAAALKGQPVEDLPPLLVTPELPKPASTAIVGEINRFLNDELDELSPAAQAVWDKIPLELRQAAATELGFQRGIGEGRDLLPDEEIDATQAAHVVPPEVAAFTAALNREVQAATTAAPAAPAAKPALGTEAPAAPAAAAQTTEAVRRQNTAGETPIKAGGVASEGPPPGLAAEAEQTLADVGGDLGIFLRGATVPRSTRAILAEAAEDEAAAAEFAACIAAGGTTT